MFIDGTNLLIELSKEIGIPFRADKPPLSAIELASIYIHTFNQTNQYYMIRRYWISSYQGNDIDRIKISSFLRKHDIEPILIKKHKGKEKGVDITLTKEMLVNAINHNYNIGFLIAGDEDYLTLVQEVKRWGPRIIGSFFEGHGLSNELKLSFDTFYQLEGRFNYSEMKIKIKTELGIK